MLRSLFNASFFNLSTIRPTQVIQFRFSTLSINYAKPICITGSMADVLGILGPLDQIFPTTNAKSYLGFLRKCVKSNNFVTGSFVHAHLVKFGWKNEILVWNVMLFVYAKAGLLGSAVKLFDEMHERDVISWCTLISGYVSNGFEIEAFELLRRMKGSGMQPNQFVISSVLKGCSGCGVLELGIMVHGLVVKSGLGFDRFVEIGLVDMYAKCRAFDNALKMFYEIPVKSPVSWNAMISGYFQNGFLIEAVELCCEMCRAGVIMDLVTLRVVINAAASLEMFGFCKNLHVYSMKVGLDKDSFVVAELVRLLSKLGEMDYMGELFKKVRKPDASLYSLLISGYHLHGHRVEAVKLARELLAIDLNPNQGALVNVLNLCLCKEEGTQIHAHVFKTARLSFLAIGNALISMYIKIGEMMDAKKSFRGMLVHDVVSWTAIIAGLVQNLQFGEALETFHALRGTGIQLDEHSLASTVNACTGIRTIDDGQWIHALSLKLGFEFCNFINASLIHMYSKCGYIKSAAMLYSYSSFHDLILLNVMIAGFCWNSLPHKALDLFVREYQVGLVPDQFSLSTIFGACSDISSLEIGEQIHCRAIKSAFDISDTTVGNAIVSMYIKSANLCSASKAFDCMQRRNMNSYQTLMMGYTQNEESGEALRLFYEMQQNGFHANPVSFARILGGCADLEAIDLGKQIHASVIKMGLVSDMYIGNALVGMYAKSKNTHRAFEASNDMSIGDETRDGNKERTVDEFGPVKLEEVTENFSTNAHFRNIFPSHQMNGTRLLFNEVQSALKMELIERNSVPDIHKKCTSFEVSPNILSEILARERGLVCSLSKHTPIKYEVMQVEGIIPDHVVLLLIFSDANKVDLDDEMFNNINSLQTSGTCSNHRALCWG